MDKIVATLLIGVLALAMYKSMTWLALAIGLVVVLAFIGDRKPVPEKTAAPAGGKEEEEVLTPVVVTDAGEPPYLYPPKMIVKVNPTWGSTNFFEEAAMGMGGLVNFLSKATTGKTLPGYKYETRWGTGRELKKRGGK